MKHETIGHEKEEGIAPIILNRPDKRNAITAKMREEPVEVLQDWVALHFYSGLGGTKSLVLWKTWGKGDVFELFAIVINS
jgi:hypothetical protein